MLNWRVEVERQSSLDNIKILCCKHYVVEGDALCAEVFFRKKPFVFIFIFKKLTRRRIAA